MIFNKNKIDGVFIVDLQPNLDSRGYFMRVYDKGIFKSNNLDREWLQENHSKSEQKGTIRGLHFQMPPYCETKLIRCVRGAVMDVFVDLRIGSKSFGQWDSIELSEENKKMIFVPRGFAHGYCTLTDVTEVVYKVDNIYKPDFGYGIIWNDKDLNIKWNLENPVLSEKDKKNFSLKEFISKFKGIEI
jgi:dTDP-4-dehydrorhamnose 3,5-epimerase